MHAANDSFLLLYFTVCVDPQLTPTNSPHSRTNSHTHTQQPNLFTPYSTVIYPATPFRTLLVRLYLLFSSPFSAWHSVPFIAIHPFYWSTNHSKHNLFYSFQKIKLENSMLGMTRAPAPASPPPPDSGTSSQFCLMDITFVFVCFFFSTFSNKLCGTMCRIIAKSHVRVEIN